MAAAKRALRIVVIGAGIGGLAAAVALRQRGYEVALYERVTKLEEVGAGLQIGPNGVKVLCALGLEDELMHNAFEPLSIMSISFDEGRLRFREPLKAVARKKYGAPYMTAHRADLHNLLRRAAGKAPLHLGAHCIGAV
jgi:salicylate hydroxylase